jgi:hypothetical protein
MMLPTRYLRTFTNVWTHTGYKSRTVTAWACKLCGKEIRPNAAGAQSHIAKHVREPKADTA